MQRVANRIVSGVKVALGGRLRRCARGKCMQRVANRIVMVGLWVGSACKELQIAM